MARYPERSTFQLAAYGESVVPVFVRYGPEATFKLHRMWMLEGSVPERWY